MDEPPYSPRQKSPYFKFGSSQSHLDDSKLGSILSTNSGGGGGTGAGGGGSSPCPRGKTMREFEAELADLRQENFELKMKIYVLEEQKSCLEEEKDLTQLKLSHHQLQKELEQVKTELSEKEDLIFKAGEAMMLISKKHEEEMADIRSQSALEVERYKELVTRLEQEIIEMKDKSVLGPRPGMFEDSTAMYAMAFNLPASAAKPSGPDSLDHVSHLEEKILELEDRLKEKSTEVNDLTAKSSSLKHEVDQLRQAEANLKMELEYRVQKLSDALSSLASAERQIQDLKSELGDNISAHGIPSEYHQLHKQYSACKTENHKLQDQVLKLHQRITELEKYNAVDLHKKIDALRKENVALHEKLSEMKEECGGGDGGGSRTADTEEASSNRENVKAIQALVKQNRALSRDVERLSGELEEARRRLLKGSEEGGRQSPGDVSPSASTSDLKKEMEKMREEKEKCELDSEDPEKAYLYSALEAKRQQVDQLNEKLRKRTIDLQELVNKELWSKNKEIEKLNRVCEKQVRDWAEQRAKLKAQEAEIRGLNEEIDRLRLLVDKASLSESKENKNLSSESNCKSEDYCLLKSELERVKCRLEEEVSRNSVLSERCEVLRLEAEGWEKSRKELVNACCLLTTRLEELSSFLESLLPSLAGRKRRLVKEAIDMSREVSKSLSLSCLDDSFLQKSSITLPPILPDVSQVDFNSEEDPEDTLLPSSEALEEHRSEVLKIRTQMDSLVERLKESSPEKKKTQSAGSGGKRNQLSLWSLSSTLQEQRDFSPQPFDGSSLFGEGIPAINLEDITEGTGIDSFSTDSEIKVIPEELTPVKDSSKRSSAGGGLQQPCPGSESEGWSEPDRQVSLARIGLKEETPPVPAHREPASDSSDSPGKTTNSSAKKRRDNEIKSLQLKIKSLEMTIDRLASEKEKKSDENNVSIDCQLLGENTLTQNLMAGLIDQREKLMLSLNQNDLIRHRLEEALSSAPSSPTKSDSEKSKSFLNSNLIHQVMKMTDKLEESCSLCLQLESKCSEIEKEKLSLVQLLSASEDKANSLAAELNSMRCHLKEKENDLLEKQCSLLELKNNVIILESKVKLSQEEVSKQTKLYESLTEESRTQANGLKEKWEKERADLINYYENEVCVLKLKVKEVEGELRRALSERERLAEERSQAEGELKIKLDRLEQEKQETSEERAQLEASLRESLKERSQLEDRLRDCHKERAQLEVSLRDSLRERAQVEGTLREGLKEQAELQARLDHEINRAADIEAAAKHSDRVWRRRLALLENSTAETEARLRRKLDQLSLSGSEAVIERTRLANERLSLQRRHAEVKEELERRVTELESANRELETRLAALGKSDSAPSSPRSGSGYKRQRSNPTSDYTSDHEHHNNIWFPVCGRNNNNSSPDLGIESDNRMSSLEQPLASPKSNVESTGGGGGGKLEAENSELRAQLARTRQALEETLAQLSSANQRKRQVEKAICRQLHKTHDILQKARLNLEPSDKHHL